MPHVLLRAISVLCVVFCCTASPVFAQPTFQTFTLNGLWADVISPSGFITVGETFYVSVAVRAHGGGGTEGLGVVLDGRPIGRQSAIELWDGIADGIPNNREWLGPVSVYATPGDIVLRITVSEAFGRGGVIELPLHLLPARDDDGDTLPDNWERGVGLSTTSAAGGDGPDGDPDGDGLRNRDEFLRHSHPRGFYTRYFAEGVHDIFFGTTFQLMATTAPPPGEYMLSIVRTLDADGWAQTTTHGYAGSGETTGGWPERTRTIGSSFATIIESDRPFVAERATSWPTWRDWSPFGYGSHASEGTASLSKRWLFAEGVIGAFNTYVTLLNPSAQPAALTVTYFGTDGVTPVVRHHTVAPESRGTIDVNVDAAGLGSTDLAIAIDSSVPIAAERSIYRNVGILLWGAGASSVGARTAAVEWFFAEGLVNPLFDTYLLLCNPGTTAAQVEIEVLRAEGGPIVLTRTIAPRSRATVHMNSASAALASSSFGMVVRSTNGAPIVAERTMWWNDPLYGTHWVEGHTSMGAPAPATRWLAPRNWLMGAGGEVSVYVLLANPGATPATVRVTLPPAVPDGLPGEVTMTVPARGRATLDVSGTFPWEIGRPDGRNSSVLVESLGDTPAPIVVERSIYANTHNAIWELGANTFLTPLPPSPTITP